MHDYIHKVSVLLFKTHWILTNVTVLLTQSRDSSRYVSRTLLASSPLWLQKHTDLRAQYFAKTPGIRNLPIIAKFIVPVAGDFVELILLYQCADVPKNHYLGFRRTELHLIALWFTASFVKHCLFSFREMYLCVCVSQITGFYVRKRR